MGRMKDHVMNEMGSVKSEIGRYIDHAPGEIIKTTLVEALAAAQVEMRNPVFDKINPHFKNKFASLAAVRDAVVPVLAKHGIAITQAYGIEDGAQVLLTVLFKGDDKIVSTVPLPPYENSQQWASATTYIRRVSLMAIAGVCGDEDDDAEVAMVAARSPEKGIPPGFDAWWAQMQGLVANGSDALRNAWTAASAEYRNFVLSSHSKDWAVMKTNAGKVAA